MSRMWETECQISSNPKKLSLPIDSYGMNDTVRRNLKYFSGDCETLEKIPEAQVVFSSTLPTEDVQEERTVEVNN